MLKIEYKIDLNKSGRPCIDLPMDYEHRPEDKFFAIEMARYFLQSISPKTIGLLDEHTHNKLNESIGLLGQLGDQMAEIVYNNLKSLGDMHSMINNDYDFSVETINDLNKLGDRIITDGKIYEKHQGLKVFVVENNKTYRLYVDDNWIEVEDDDTTEYRTR